MTITITSQSPITFNLSAATNINDNFTFSYSVFGALITNSGVTTSGLDTVTDPVTHQQYKIAFTADKLGLGFGAGSGQQLYSIQIPTEYFNFVQTAYVEYSVKINEFDPANFTLKGQATQKFALFLHGSGTPPPPPPPRFTQEQKVQFQSDANNLQSLSNAMSDLAAATDPLHPVAKLAGSIAGQLAKAIEPHVGTVNSAVQAVLGVVAGALEETPPSNPIGLTLGIASAIDSMASLLLQKLANDPPDANFKTVFQAPNWSFGTLPGASAAANTLLLDSWKLFQAAANALAAAERFQGAEYAGDTASQGLQDAAFNTALDAYTELRAKVSGDLITYLAEVSALLPNIDLSTDASLANVQAYLRGLSNPGVQDPFLAAVIASISATAPALSGTINTDMSAAVQSLENLQTPTVAGSAFAAITAIAHHLGSTSTSLLNALSLEQQLELIYIGYFNRSADGSGFDFWAGQNKTAQSAGQSAEFALTNIANSFVPQAETIALYPFLNTAQPDFTDVAVKAGLSSFIENAYANLFGHVADAGGAAYWKGQIESGAIGLGAAVLAIANGAQASDAIILYNRTTVAHEFTSLTSAAQLAVTPALIAEAKLVLAGVDGNTFNDASVTAAKALIAPWIAGQLQPQSVALVGIPDVSGFIEVA